MNESAALSHKLASEGQKLSRFLENLTAGGWSAVVYAGGATWTVRSILAHLVSAEWEFLRLFDDVRRGGIGSPEDFSVDQYNADQQESSKDLVPAELLSEFSAVRAQMAAFVGSLSSAELDKRGRHPHLGFATLREMVKLVYIHNQAHYRDVRRALTSQ
jgi:hypothetical protein